ncbi:MAG TPA: serine/threonine-protein kinase [Kofleriaceae bacterium]|nr:serine/threonine-protein kinase [Kofleriaceae bacterium]
MQVGGDGRDRAQGPRAIEREPAHSGTVTTLVRDVDSPPRPSEAPVRRSGQLPPGTAVGRYVVLEAIAEGGMGIVYRALDPELDRAIALKLLRVRPDGPEERERQKTRLVREAQAMARLSHPNVISVHDVGTFEDDVFVAMELAEGCTLSRFLLENRPTARDVIALFAGAGRGLAAAHAAGLVHRDFKPDNVAVGHDGRARVLDFGLARAVQTSPGPEAGVEKVEEAWSSPRLLEAALTRDGAVIGTPIYMAPEQFRGDVFDARADQFSFCVALYEALYGELPFYERATRRFTWRPVVLPASPRLPERARRALTRGLALDAAERHPSMDALLADLEPAAADAPRAGRIARFALMAVALAIAATTALATARLLDRDQQHAAVLSSQPAGALAVAPDRPMLAFLPFADSSAREDGRWMRALLDAAFEDELGADASVGLVALDEVASILEADVPPQRSPEAISRLASAFAAEFAIDPGFVVVGEGSAASARIQLRIVDPRGRVAGRITGMVELAHLDEGVRSISKRLHWTIGLAPESAAGQPRSSGLPTGPEALRLYGDALDIEARDPSAARALLERASSLEPDCAGLHAALARTWAREGRVDRARASAEAAVERARSWPPRRRATLAFRTWYALGEWTRAASAYEELIPLGPADLGLAITYGQVLMQADRHADARNWIAALSHGDRRARRVPRLLLQDAQSSMFALDCDAAMATARSAAEAAHATGVRGMGRVEADALAIEGQCARVLGHPERAREAGVQALALGEALGAASVQLNALAVIGAVEADYDPAAARGTLARRLALAREQHSREQVADTLCLLAQLEAWEDPAAAQRRLGEALVIYRDMGSADSQAYVSGLLAELGIRRGNLAAARRHAEAAVSLRTTDREMQTLANNLTTLGTVLLLQGNIAPGKRRLGDAIALVQQFQGDASTARHALAEGMIAAGESSAALELARSIVPADQPADPVVLTLEAVALSELGRGPEALATVARAEQAFTDSDAPRLAHRARVCIAGIKLRHAKKAVAARARRELVRLATQADARGDRLTALDARALAATGRPRQLSAVAARAASLGYGLLAQRIRRELGREKPRR